VAVRAAVGLGSATVLAEVRRECGTYPPLHKFDKLIVCHSGNRQVSRRFAHWACQVSRFAYNRRTSHTLTTLHFNNHPSTVLGKNVKHLFEFSVGVLKQKPACIVLGFV
jgi:hypothetical protein